MRLLDAGVPRARAAEALAEAGNDPDAALRWLDAAPARGAAGALDLGAEGEEVTVA